MFIYINRRLCRLLLEIIQRVLLELTVWEKIWIARNRLGKEISRCVFIPATQASPVTGPNDLKAFYGIIWSLGHYNHVIWTYLKVRCSVIPGSVDFKMVYISTKQILQTFFESCVTSGCYCHKFGTAIRKRVLNQFDMELHRWKFYNIQSDLFIYFYSWVFQA